MKTIFFSQQAWKGRICNQRKCPYIILAVLSILSLTWLVLMALFWASIRGDSVSLLRFSFLRHLQVFYWEISIVCCSKCRYSCFFNPFCFVGFVLLELVRIVSRRCNLSSSALFDVIIQSLYRCIDAILNANESSSSFFSWHINSDYVIYRM